MTAPRDDASTAPPLRVPSAPAPARHPITPAEPYGGTPTAPSDYASPPPPRPTAGPPGPGRPDASPVAPARPFTGEPATVDAPTSARRTVLTYAGAILIALTVGFGTFLALSAGQSSGGRTLPLLPGSTTSQASGTAAIGPTHTAGPNGTGGGGGGSRPVGPDPAPATTTIAPAAPPPPVLVATYSSSPRLLGLSGYVGQLHIANPDKRDAHGWTVVITLPASATFESASGAVVEQNGSRFTFSPTAATRTVAGGSSIDVTFDVGGLLAAQPSGCSIDERACG